MAGIDGVVRDDKGIFIFAFGRKKLHWDSAHLELSTFKAFEGICHDWTRNIKGIVLEGDNKNVLQYLLNLYSKPKIIKGNSGDEGILFFSNFNNVIFNCVNRNCNKLVDYCANLALSFDFDWDLFLEDNLPSSFVKLVKKESDRCLIPH